MADMQNPAGQGGVCGNFDPNQISPQNTLTDSASQGSRRLSLVILGGGGSVRVHVDDGGEPRSAVIPLSVVPALLRAFVQAEQQETALASAFRAALARKVERA
jgi:hypothetical protein